MRRHFTHTAIFAGAALIAACTAEEQTADPAPVEVAVEEDATVSLKPVMTRELDPVAGRSLFVEKGCVICHSVNGVGGKAAPALDAEIGAPDADPLDFAARIWRGAPAMIELQSVELGYTIYLTADEIAHLSAFAADREAQRSLTLESLPENIRAGLLDERFWELENWDEFLRDGREGEFPEDMDEVPEDPL